MTVSTVSISSLNKNDLPVVCDIAACQPDAKESDGSEEFNVMLDAATLGRAKTKNARTGYQGKTRDIGKGLPIQRGV